MKKQTNNKTKTQQQKKDKIKRTTQYAPTKGCLPIRQKMPYLNTKNNDAASQRIQIWLSRSKCVWNIPIPKVKPTRIPVRA